MISQSCHRFSGALSEDQGFFISARTEEAAFEELRQYAIANPQKWIYYYPCGLRPAKDIPVPEFVIEVRHATERREYPLSFFKVFQHQGEIKNRR